MERRSLLDYIDDGSRPEAPSRGRPPAARLEQRLAELEGRLAAVRAGAECETRPEASFSSQIESILHRQPSPMPKRQAEPPVSLPSIARPVAGNDMRTPIHPDAPQPAMPERSAEFSKFVEAVHLIGQAASRFLRDPPAPRDPQPTQEMLKLTVSLQETVAAFQAMTTDLVKAAGDMRRIAAEPVRAIQPPPARSIVREDDELLRLQDDLDELRDRLGEVIRRRGRQRD